LKPTQTDKKQRSPHQKNGGLHRKKLDRDPLQTAQRGELAPKPKKSLPEPSLGKKGAQEFSYTQHERGECQPGRAVSMCKEMEGTDRLFGGRSTQIKNVFGGCSVQSSEVNQRSRAISKDLSENPIQDLITRLGRKSLEVSQRGKVSDQAERKESTKNLSKKDKGRLHQIPRNLKNQRGGEAV